MLLDTKKKQNKFILSMIIIITCATVINYGIFTLLNTYYITSKTNVDQNILLMVIIIGITSLLMFILIPKETADNVSRLLETGDDGAEKTPEQQLADMMDVDEYDLKDTK